MDSAGTVQAEYSYSNYGERTKASGNLDSDWGYAGLWHHQASGLDLATYRAYDAANKRWISRDPLGEGVDYNLYRYCGNSPINHVDPSGLETTIYTTGGHSYTVTTGDQLIDLLQGNQIADGSITSIQVRSHGSQWGFGLDYAGGEAANSGGIVYNPVNGKVEIQGKKKNFDLKGLLGKKLSKDGINFDIRACVTADETVRDTKGNLMFDNWGDNISKMISRLFPSSTVTGVEGTYIGVGTDNFQIDLGGHRRTYQNGHRQNGWLFPFYY